jgi:glucose-1-phosphate cytidylyltransferase
MKHYSHFGLNEFVICCGYKGHMIKAYFAEYVLHSADVTFDLLANRMEVHQHQAEPWRVTLADTGEQTMTGGRIKRVRRWLGNETFCLTYGDGVSDVDIGALIRFHRAQNAMATVTAVRQPGRFGALSVSPGEVRVRSFCEKPLGDGLLINGGFFVLEPQVVDYIDGDATVFEQEPLRRLAEEGVLAAYHHHGFWQNLDTLRDKNLLEQMLASGKAPWQVWKRAAEVRECPDEMAAKPAKR